MKRKGLGRILKDISEKKDKKVSVVTAINKECTSSVESFSMLSIKRHLKSMLELMEDEDFDRDSFFLTFYQLYNLVMAPDRRAGGVFHPSQLLDGCTRRMTFEISGVAPTDEKMRVIGPELQRTFDVGTWYHIYIQAMLFKMGWLEQAEVPVVDTEKFLNGKADGVFKKEIFGERVVLEVKTMNNWNFSKAIFKPFKKHEFQASLYARTIGIKKVLYLYINKDTSEIREFLEDVNEEQLAAADKIMDKVISHSKEKTLPPRKCADKYCDNALECPYTSLCFK